MKGWTYGAEHELGDWPIDRPLPPNYGIDRRDTTMVNSNGIAVDPKGITYRFGGEINTPPTDNPEGQAFCLLEILRFHPECVVNYRSNLHIHVRIPGLSEDLGNLKRLQLYIHEFMPAILHHIEPIEPPNRKDFGTEEEYKGAVRRIRRRRVSHHTLLKRERLFHQCQATNVKEFFEREVPKAKKDGKPLWTTQPRLCVNLRQLLQTDTIEFRHFPGTLNADELLTCVSWCRDFLLSCLYTEAPSIKKLLSSEKYQSEKFPSWPKYVHWMEKRYRATVRDGTVPKKQVMENIERILNGTFDERGPDGRLRPSPLPREH